MKQLRLALIGCGGISGAHRVGIKQLGGQIKLVAVCDVNPEAACAAADSSDDKPAVYSKYEEVLARDDVQAVDLLLPHDLHPPVAIAAARAGKHILCEKPIAPTRREAREMIAAAEQAGVKLMIAYCERYDSRHQAVRALLDEGAIGRLHLTRIDHDQWVSYPVGHWINDPAKLGGGTVAGSGTHRLDLLRWFNGEVSRVFAFSHHSGMTPLRGEDMAVISLEFASGAIGEMTICWSCPRFPWYEGLWLYGDRGVIHNVGGLQISRREGEGKGGEFEPVPLPYEEGAGFREEIRHFANCVLEDRQPLTDGYEALKALELVEAVYRSAASKQVVELPLGDE